MDGLGGTSIGSGDGAGLLRQDSARTAGVVTEIGGGTELESAIDIPWAIGEHEVSGAALSEGVRDTLGLTSAGGSCVWVVGSLGELTLFTASSMTAITAPSYRA
jgi:hypothetical protein